MVVGGGAGASVGIEPALYAPRLVQDQAGGWNLLAFKNVIDGQFVGELCDPIAVTADPRLGLVAR